MFGTKRCGLNRGDFTVGEYQTKLSVNK